MYSEYMENTIDITAQKEEAIRQVRVSFADHYVVEYVTQKWGVRDYKRITLDEAINYINNATFVNVDSGDVYLGNAAIISRDVS
jgi:hypothetical protein